MFCRILSRIPSFFFLRLSNSSFLRVCSSPVSNKSLASAALLQFAERTSTSSSILLSLVTVPAVGSEQENSNLSGSKLAHLRLRLICLFVELLWERRNSSWVLLCRWMRRRGALLVILPVRAQSGRFPQPTVHVEGIHVFCRRRIDKGALKSVKDIEGFDGRIAEHDITDETI